MLAAEVSDDASECFEPVGASATTFRTRRPLGSASPCTSSLWPSILPKRTRLPQRMQIAMFR